MSALTLASGDNPLLHQWGLASTVIGLCVPVFGAMVLWLRVSLKRAKEGGPAPTTREALQIKSVLGDIFQKTVVEQACEIFQQIDDRLPIALSQSESSIPQTSAFDRLCARLRDVDPDDPDREQLRDILRDSLGTLVTGQVRRFLASLSAAISAGQTAAGQPSEGIRASLGGDAERRLSFLATKIAQVNRVQRNYGRFAKWAHRLLSLSGCAGLAAVPMLFFDRAWAYWAGGGLLSTFATAGLAGGLCFAVAYGSSEWIEHCAERHAKPADWDEELKQHRAR